MSWRASCSSGAMPSYDSQTDDEMRDKYTFGVVVGGVMMFVSAAIHILSDGAPSIIISLALVCFIYYLGLMATKDRENER